MMACRFYFKSRGLAWLPTLGDRKRILMYADSSGTA